MGTRIAAFCVLVCAALLPSCLSTRTGTAGQILEHQREIDRLEERIRARDRAIDSAVRELERVAERSSGMGSSIDEIVRELDEYQRAVERLLADYRTARAETEEKD